MHAGWNLLARRQRAEAAFFNRMLAAGAIVGFLPAVLSEILTHSITLKAWICVVGSGFCCGMYFCFLARAYRSSDFTMVYPGIRSLPVLFVAVGDILRGRYLSPIGWLGIVLTASGCFLVPLHSIRDFALRRYINRTSFQMLLAATGTVGYTLLDKIASEAVSQGPATAARYGYMFFLISWGSYSVFSRMFSPSKQDSSLVGWKSPVLAACLCFGAYWLVLWAYQLSQHASYVVAFRQFSIIIGAILGFVIYKERGVAVRLTGSFLLTCGLILIALSGG